ncbi:MAG: NYN domain-containing protein [Gammaproteobacteria bacterium]|nr:NYN domain-containing protein [Gammaproteobacteria bacterium]
MSKDEQRAALLIDADNADPTLRTEIERRARKHGRIVRRLGFGRGPSRKWKDGEPALEWPTQDGQNAGRNAADIDLAFTAGELLHTDDIDCFCIASGDSDFAGLARRLRDAGKTVIGIGEPTKTAKAFRDACDRFEKVGTAKSKGTEAVAQPKPKKAKRTSTQPEKTAKAGPGKRKEFLKLVRAATVKERGQWLLATWLGDRLRTLRPGFRNEDFGAKRLSTLLKAYPAQIELRQGPKGAEFRMRGQSAETASTTHEDGPAKAEAGTAPAHDERLADGKAQQGGAMSLTGTACGTDDGANRWLGKLPEDLASLGPEAWDAIVREAEDEATRTKEWASGAARMIDEHFEELCAERESSMLQMAMGLIEPEDVIEPWNALVTFGTWPRPMRLEDIERESRHMVDRLLPLKPMAGAVRHQHDADPGLRRKARRIIVDHFRGSGMEQHYGKQWTA